MASDLLQLSQIISSSVSTIDARCRHMSQDFPRLNEPFNAGAEAVYNDAEITQATFHILAAAAQLIASVKTPSTALMDTASGCLLSAALGTVSSSAVAEILRDAGPEGCHVKDIAVKNKTDPSRIGRLLRALATHHIFREVSPDVFTHNRLSSLLDTGRPVAAVVGSPLDKHTDSQGFSSIIECTTDEMFKSAAYLKETVMDPATSHSEEPTECAFNTAFKTNLNFFAWYELPENAYRLKRFSMAMDGSRRMSPPETILRGFDWTTLPQGSRVIDVGGGVGSSSMAIARVSMTPILVIQDRPAVSSLAEQYWKSQFPEALSQGRVEFQAHDFLTPQPPQNNGCAVFLLRLILHDWSDSYALRILRHLRAAAGTNTKLVILDYIILHACRADDAGAGQKIPGAEELEIIKDPSPLLPNLGLASSRPYFVDLLTMAVFNGEERTLGKFVWLLGNAGWKIERVYRLSNQQQQIVACPI